MTTKRLSVRGGGTSYIKVYTAEMGRILQLSNE
jgi:hypothetical protein